MKTAEELKALLDQLKFPSLGPGPDYADIEVPCTSFITKGVLAVSAEDGLGIVDYYGEFRGGCQYIHEKLEAFAKEHGGCWQWRDPGSIELYEE